MCLTQSHQMCGEAIHYLFDVRPMNEFPWKAGPVAFRKLGEQSVQLGGVVAEYLDTRDQPWPPSTAILLSSVSGTRCSLPLFMRSLGML
jgi:hypothetical protein